VAERTVAEFYEAAVLAAETADAKTVANWVTGALFGLMNEASTEISDLLFDAKDLAALLDMVANGEVNPNGARQILAEMFAKGGKPAKIVKARGLRQVSDAKQLHTWIATVLDTNPQQVAEYQAGNSAVLNWLFGQVMQVAGGKANPQALRAELQKQLAAIRLEGENTNG
jgi:aspartyl-tRNA(Asn)/glutamyl-tRNA(Gln) amidotransferase subunit B